MSYINKPGKNTAWKKRVLKNLVADVILYEKIETDLKTAKSLTQLLARLITWAKELEFNKAEKYLSQHLYRKASSKLANKNKKDVINKLFLNLGKRYQNRKGGYSRILRSKLRRGDGSLRVFFSLV